MQVSFRIDAASYGSFIHHTEVVLRREGSATVVVTCESDEVEFKPAGEPLGMAWTARRLSSLGQS